MSFYSLHPKTVNSYTLIKFIGFKFNIQITELQITVYFTNSK